MFDIQLFNEKLENLATKRNVKLNSNYELYKVDKKTKFAYFKNKKTNETKEQ